MAVISGKFSVKLTDIDIGIIKKTLSLDDTLVCIRYKNSEETIHECDSKIHRYIIEKGDDKNISVNSLSIELKYNMFDIMCVFDDDKCIINWCSRTYQEENNLVDCMLKYLKSDAVYDIIKIYPITEMYKMPNNFHKLNFIKYLRAKNHKFSSDGMTLNLYDAKFDNKCVYFRYTNKDNFLRTKYNIETILSDFLGYHVVFVHNICIEI